MKTEYITWLFVAYLLLRAYSDMILHRKVYIKEFLARGQEIIPKLTTSLRKGQLGRIGVIGGSLDYTGAPYYASQSALKFGADIAFVFCAKQALIPIKSYSPELMVTSFYDGEVDINDHVKFQQQVSYGVDRIIGALHRLHVLVIGPGLGRDAIPLQIIPQVISYAKDKNIPVIIDADGLYVISQNLSLIRNYKNCVLTPNAAELDRLASAILSEISSSPLSSTSSSPSQYRNEDIRKELSSSCPYRVIMLVARYLGNVTIVRKGLYDLISNGEAVYEVIAEQSPRRCGGQGDIFAGNLAVAFHWCLSQPAPPKQETIVFERELSYDEAALAGGNESQGGYASTTINLSMTPSIEAAILASYITRGASYRAYQQHRRSMTSPDVMLMIGSTMEELFPTHDNVNDNHCAS